MVTYRREADNRSSLSVFYEDMFILRLENIHRLELAKFVFNQLNGSNMFMLTTFSQIHSYNTRGADRLIQNNSMPGLSYRFALSEGIRLWNSLPIDITHSNQMLSFKNKMKLHLFYLQHR